MRRHLIWLLCSLVTVVTVATPAATDPHVARGLPTPLVAHHPMLRSSLDRIASGSRLWREAVQALEGSGRRALVLTPDQVRVRDRADSAVPQVFDPALLAEVSPVVVAGSEVPIVVVVVNVPLLQRVHHDQPWSSPADVQRDLDRIVIHEVYGHAFPYLIAGDVSGRCPDAQPGQRAIDACAIQRENAVRSELRLGIREDAGLNGLTLATRRLLSGPVQARETFR